MTKEHHGRRIIMNFICCSGFVVITTLLLLIPFDVKNVCQAAAFAGGKHTTVSRLRWSVYRNAIMKPGVIGRNNLSSYSSSVDASIIPEDLNDLQELMDSSATDFSLHNLNENNHDMQNMHEKMKIDRMSADSAYCNHLYRISIVSDDDSIMDSTLIAKIFSPLGLQRMGVDSEKIKIMGRNATTSKTEKYHHWSSIHTLVADEGLGPAIVGFGRRAILMEECKGIILTEGDVHGGGKKSLSVAQKVAMALAALHDIEPETSIQNGIETNFSSTLSLPRDSNLLWSSCDVMLSKTDQRWQLPTSQNENEAFWNTKRLEEEIRWQKKFLDSQRPSKTRLGHGDCKPSNIAIDMENGIVQFIDLELSGPHYRAFDLAKFLRTEMKTENEDSIRQRFLEAYLKTWNEKIDDNIQILTLKELEREVDLLMPLTWLEAALFFACMVNQVDSSVRENFNRLAADRLEGYERCLINSCILEHVEHMVQIKARQIKQA